MSRGVKMPDTQDLTFDEFRDAVNAASKQYGENKIRAALTALQLTPYTKLGDMRRTYYSRAWVERVWEFLERTTQ